MSEFSVGIDVSKATLDVYGVPSQLRQTLDNNLEGWQQLAAQLQGLPVKRVVVEATGGYERALVAQLLAEGLPVAVVNPRQAHNFAKATGKLAKTDRIDAELLARFGDALVPELRSMPSELELLLKDTLARRRQLVAMQTMEKNRQQQAAAHRVQLDVEAHLQFLKKRIDRIDKELDDLIRQSPAWQAKFELLQTVPGVGKQLSRTIVAELPELGSCSRQKIAALVGVAPLNRDSGVHRGKRMTFGGRSTVRTKLYMAAMSAARWNAPLKAYYERLRAAGKATKLARIAVARKLLVMLNAMVRDQQPWQPATA